MTHRTINEKKYCEIYEPRSASELGKELTFWNVLIYNDYKLCDQLAPYQIIARFMSNKDFRLGSSSAIPNSDMNCSLPACYVTYVAKLSLLTKRINQIFEQKNAFFRRSLPKGLAGEGIELVLLVDGCCGLIDKFLGRNDTQ